MKRPADVFALQASVRRRQLEINPEREESVRFASKVTLARHAVGMSIDQLAELLRVLPSLVAMIEEGRLRPSPGLKVALAAHLPLEFSLFDGSHEKSSHKGSHPS